MTEIPIKHVHFIGVGGAGMSGLAEILLARGLRVSGSDVSESPKIDELRNRGATVLIGHAAQNVEEGVDLVVYSSAVKNARNPELEETTRRGIKAMRRADFMAWLIRDLKTIAVAGTHGKTTTTSMIAAILMEAGFDPTVLVGASVKELKGQNARAGSGNLAVVEADEYDRSFLALQPYIAVLTSLEAEHLDIYKDLDDLKSAFTQFANQHSPHDREGFVVVCIDEKSIRELTPRLEKRIVTYGIASSEAKYKAIEIRHKGQKIVAAIQRGVERIGDLELGVPGEHNLKNALAALAVAEILAVPFETTRKALKKFAGAERRFQIKGEAAGVLVIDDYAHHPTEIQATLTTVRNAYPGRRVLACFQPHTFTRTRDFYQEFGETLSAHSDHVFLLDVYPAREQPIEGITSEKILNAMRSAGTTPVEWVKVSETLPDLVVSTARAGDVVLTIGAGTITELALPILELLKRNERKSTSNALSENTSAPVS